MAIGEKRIETRSWRTKHRGLLAIHAAKKFPYWCDNKMHQALERHGLNWLALPRGAFVAVVNLKNCTPTGDLFLPDSDKERAFGDFHGSRFAWMTATRYKIPAPIPYRGRQGLWNVDEDMSEKLLTLFTTYHQMITTQKGESP
jgi:hypothetical protein